MTVNKWNFELKAGTKLHILNFSHALTSEAFKLCLFLENKVSSGLLLTFGNSLKWSLGDHQLQFNMSDIFSNYLVENMPTEIKDSVVFFMYEFPKRDIFEIIHPVKIVGPKDEEVAQLNLDNEQMESILSIGITQLLQKEKMESKYNMGIKDITFSGPATIVFFNDGTKEVSKPTALDKYQPEVGLAMCIAKKAFGTRSQFQKAVKKALRKNQICKNCFFRIGTTRHPTHVFCTKKSKSVKMKDRCGQWVVKREVKDLA